MILNIRTCNIGLEPTEEKVDSSLSMTPSNMLRLTSQGRSVSLSSLENMSFYGNELDVRDMPIEFQRGIDMNTLWSESRKSDKKIRDFVKSTKNITSDGNQLKGGN